MADDTLPIRIVEVVPQASQEASGPSYSVVRLCQALVAAGGRVRLLAIGPGPLAVEFPGAELHPGGKLLGRLEHSESLRRALREAAQCSDVIHSHSLWALPNVYPGWATKGRSCRLVVSPRGTLSRWALNHSKWEKRIYWNLLQRPAISHAACFHATADSEYAEIRAAGLLRQPVAIIPNGVDVPELREQPSPGPRTLLFLGRIHQKKGVDLLLRAWHAIESRYPDWQLRIVGPDDRGHLGTVRALANELGLRRATFAEPLFGEAKVAAYREAQLFVLPTHSENFGMTVAEALAAGTPAIVTKGAPWSGLVEHGAGWWIDIGVDALVACLEEALPLSPHQLRERGLAGHSWMKREYSWDLVGAKMHTTYRWLLFGGDRPTWIRTD
jgi:glycosyltransferase involved in cell wall biosynthesis